jgi:thiol-disulfide isomerase/thioredoxin
MPHLIQKLFRELFQGRLKALLALSIALGAWPPASAAEALAATAELAPLMAKDVPTKVAQAKVTIVNLWATWCAPCKEEMPELIGYQKANASKGVQLLLVSGDSPGDFKEAAQFLEKLGADFPTYRLSEAPDEFMKILGEPQWPAIVPTTMIYDQKAKRIGYWAKRVPMKELQAIVNKTLGGKSSFSPTLATPKKMGSH